ncbi:MAG: hypothetical protein U5P41_01780 [Gammaproteobacteria bacterium]|nr:hypothetical protein [Gammaproteobacteria bacterium]
MNNPPRQEAKANPRLVIIVLILIFSAPLLSSWFILNYTDLINTGGASHGDLYDPLVALPDVSLRDPFAAGDRDAGLHGKWSLLYISAGGCNESCTENLYRMRQIRLALSRYARNLQRVWMTDIEDPEAIRQILGEYQGTLILPMETDDPPLPLSEFATAPVSEPLQADCLYAIDPHGNLVLRYRPGTDPEGIISDLKRLLKSTEISR